jgi:hypothetical protein
MKTKNCSNHAVGRTIVFCGLPGLLLAAAALCAEQPGTEVTMQWVILTPGGKTGVKKEEFSRQAKPGPGKELRVFMLANRECTVSFAGFTHDGQLVYGSPETVTLPANIVKELPVSKKWTFDGQEQLFEIDAVIADPAAVDYKTYAALVGKMGQAGISTDVWQAQAAALREWIDGKLRSKTSSVDYTVKDNPADIGGVIRGGLQGQKLMVPPQKTSIVRIRMQ